MNKRGNDKPVKPDAAAFFKAAAKGDVARLNRLLAGGQDANARDAAGRTALMRAADSGHTECVRTLLGAGADARATINNRDSIWRGGNALFFAAQNGDVTMVELLVESGAMPACVAADGTTPLHFAVDRKLTAMVKCLLAAGTSLRPEDLVTSVWAGSDDISKLLIAAGANPNARDDLGQSALHCAAEHGQNGVVQALISAKAKLNAKANGTTPLLTAIQNGHEECGLQLLKAGADVSATGLLRRDALMNAAAMGQNRMVKALLEVGANPKAKDKDGKTALMLANEKEHAEVVRLLREGGSDESGYAIQEFIRAAIKGDVECVRQSLDSGVDVNAVYQNGANALVSAVRLGHVEVVRLLLERGALASTTSSAKAWGTQFHADALALAAEKGNLEIVRLLLGAGADVRKSRMFGLSVLNAAMMGAGDPQIVRELIAAGVSLKGADAVEALERAVRKKKESAAFVLVTSGLKLGGRAAANVLVRATELGMARLVKAMLDAGVDPKLRNEYDETALQAARSAGHKELVAILTQARSPQTSPGTELVEAAEAGNLGTVRRLILEGADLESRDAKGATALIRASANGHLQVMRALLKAGANPNATTHFAKRNKAMMFHHMDLTSESPLSCAVSARSLPAVELLVEAGADIRRTECGHLACMILQEGEKEGAALVERLLDLGMEPDVRWPVINVSALEISAQEGFQSLVEKLLKAGARLNNKWERDRIILDAIQRERTEIARLLIERGIDPRLKGTITSEALVTAAQLGLDDIVKMLLKRNVKIDSRVDTAFDGEGTVEEVTALMAAARYGRSSTVELLLAAGANPNTEDATRRTALDWARDNKSPNLAQRISRMLIAAGANE
jgi:ankyrin repeat protein